MVGMVGGPGVAQEELGRQVTVEDGRTFDSGEGQPLDTCAQGTCLSAGATLIVKKKLGPELCPLKKKICGSPKPQDLRR